MFLEIKNAKYINDFKIFLEFNDGISKTVDFVSNLFSTPAYCNKLNTPVVQFGKVLVIGKLTIKNKVFKLLVAILCLPVKIKVRCVSIELDFFFSL